MSHIHVSDYFWWRRGDRMRDVVRRAMTKAPATLNALTMVDPLGNPKRPIRRRVFVAGSVALLAAPWVADGQERNPARIGALLLTSNPENFQRQFGEALQELGYAQGRNIAIEYRSAAAGEVDRLAELAGELVRLRSDIIVAQNTPAAQAAKRATADIPIVIMAGDPVGTGLVSSLARPGGNVTGVSAIAAEFGGKLLQLLRELLPTANQFATLAHATDPFARPFVEQIQSAARDVGVRIQLIVVRGAEEFSEAFASMVRERSEAVVIQPILATRRAAELAVESRLASIATGRSFAEAGGLLSYAADQVDLYRRAAYFVDRILKGAKPADLPVEQPTRFELVINLKTAQALGLSVPQSLLARADEVIE
jgi:putative tryptophan/tyrosine transport system substrate-binding protein